eukprot:GEZU01023069.1.p1 GENE.GEZU01023069.1~~GEZU01023069.1.p1  ORF type:complete len:136 (-),score=9.63 GEZU01023069.1:165-539(-)
MFHGSVGGDPDLKKKFLEAIGKQQHDQSAASAQQPMKALYCLIRPLNDANRTKQDAEQIASKWRAQLESAFPGSSFAVTAASKNKIAIKVPDTAETGRVMATVRSFGECYHVEHAMPSRFHDEL